MTASDQPMWRFRRMARAELNTDPVEGEFFTPQGIADALVREAIQNSLDARLNRAGDPVRVRFRFATGARALPPERVPDYLRGLRPHLEAQAELDFIPDESAPMPFLAIEDFGTRGLCGDPIQDHDLEGSAEQKNHFYYFWRNIGRSAKGDKDLGRWGLGKTVFPATSRINSFFGLTQRADDGRQLLMGQSVLKIHAINGERRYPYGDFASHAVDDDFALPLEAPDLIQQFSSDFGLQRDGKAGLSIVIPYPDPELTPLDVVRAVLVQYFFPILSEELAVEFVSPAETQRLDASTIDLITRQLSSDGVFRPDELLSLYELARWSLEVLEEEHLILGAAGGTSAPAWAESLFPGVSLSDLQKRWERGERIAITAQVPVQRKGEASRLTRFDLFLQRDERLQRAEEHYVRQGITIPGIRMVRERAVRGLVLVEDPLLSSLLGDSENPAHTDWQERRDLVRRRYEKGSSAIRFVRGSLREVVRLLGRAPEGREENLLRDVFFVDRGPTLDSESRGRRRKPRVQQDPPPVPLEPALGSRPFRLEPRDGGFVISGIPGASEAGDRISLRAAYRVRRGDPFAAYDPLDFRLDRPPIVTHLDRAGVENVGDNLLEVRVDSPDFRVTVSGFDPNRDLVVSARRRSEAG